MGAKCCKGEELKDGQDAMPQGAAQSAMAEETVKAPVPLAAAAAEVQGGGEEEMTEFNITLKKTADEPRLGVDVDLTDNVCLLVDKVNDGLIMNWNKEHPDKAVKVNDKIVSVNGTRGDAHKMTEVCKESDDLEMVIQRSK
mmetsp:Transcript_99665/g.277565  ORF Transcript_99665/g.277565 Transcript_99665/m.277565 type:complete len:141 (-) Transcript_99665:214-636(-)